MKAASQSDATQTTEELFLRLAERGCKARVVPVQHVRDLREEVKGQLQARLIGHEILS